MDHLSNNVIRFDKDNGLLDFMFCLFY